MDYKAESEQINRERERSPPVCTRRIFYIIKRKI